MSLDTSFLGKGYIRVPQLKQYCLDSEHNELSAEQLDDYDRAGLIGLANRLNQLSLDAGKKKGGKKGGKKSKKKHGYANEETDSDQDQDSDEKEDSDAGEDAEEKEEQPFRVYVGAYSATSKRPVTRHAPAKKGTKKGKKKKAGMKYSTAAADEGEGKLFLSSDSDQEVEGTSVSETYKRKSKKGKGTKKGKHTRK